MGTGQAALGTGLHSGRKALLVAGLAAAAVSGGLGEVTADWFAAGGNFALGPQQGGGATLQSIRDAAVRNASLTYAAQAGILGLAFGLAGAVGNRRRNQGAIGAAVGLVLGLVLGLLVSHRAYLIFLKSVDPNSDDLLVPILTHGLVWGLIGGVAGLAYGLGSGAGVGRAAAGGIAGGILAAGAFQVLGAIVFASAHTTQPLAEGTAPRLAAQVLMALLAAAAIGLTRPTVLAETEPRPIA